MNKFKFYEVNIDYINYLKQVENKIPNIIYTNNNKFLCGVLFEINNLKYYAPISSFKKPQKTNFIIKNKHGDSLSSIRLSFMFPVPDNLLTVKDFSAENPQYKRLLIEELDYCNKNADKIIKKALYIYNQVITHNNPLFQNICCNFKLLEDRLSKYQIEAEQSKKEAAAAKEEAENVSKEISTVQENAAVEKTQKTEAKRYNVEIIENIEFDSEIEFKDSGIIFHNYKAAAEKAAKEKQQAAKKEQTNEVKKGEPQKGNVSFTERLSIYSEIAKKQVNNAEEKKSLNKNRNERER